MAIRKVKFELVFKDGTVLIVHAPTFSSAIATGAYYRYIEEGEMFHKALTVNEKLCKQLTF